MEVSSHALALSRVDGIEFDVAAFLNLGRDHLDFHRDLDDYFEAKATLFEPGRAAASVVWVDDPKGEVFYAAKAAGMPTTVAVLPSASSTSISSPRRTSVRARKAPGPDRSST